MPEGAFPVTASLLSVLSRHEDAPAGTLSRLRFPSVQSLPLGRRIRSELEPAIGRACSVKQGSPSIRAYIDFGVRGELDRAIPRARLFAQLCDLRRAKQGFDPRRINPLELEVARHFDFLAPKSPFDHDGSAVGES